MTECRLHCFHPVNLVNETAEVARAYAVESICCHCGQKAGSGVIEKSAQIPHGPYMPDALELERITSVKSQ